MKFACGGVACLIAILSGCATTLTPAGTDVKLSTSRPAANCQSLGPIHLGPSMQMERAQTQMLNSAAKRGANYVHAVGVDHTAYYCPYDASAANLAH